MKTKKAKNDKAQTQDLNLIQLAKIVGNKDAARELLESIRWSDGIPVCPKCGEKGAYKLTPNPKSKHPVRNGVWKCKSCRKQFTVTVGTIFEDSHIPLSKWLLAYYLFCAAKNGISAHELHRDLDIKYQTAWFMVHRIRHSLGIESTAEKLEGTIEVDETYVGGKPRFGTLNNVDKTGKRNKKGRGTKKIPVVALVQRNGSVRTRVIADVTGKTLKQAIRDNVHKNSTIMTDEWAAYNGIGKEFVGGHHVVNHGHKEYARGEANTNTAESFFGTLKRAVYGTWHHVSKEHLHRYVTETEYRWNSRTITDGERTKEALGLIGGKRLTYKTVVTR